MSRLADRTEVLLRQVHPTWRNDDGTVTRQVFKPTPKDEGRLSVDRSSKISAEAAFDAHQQLGSSTMVLGVAVGEIDDSGSSAYDDPVADKPAHAYIDFTGLARKQVDGLAAQLRDFAVVRGVLHP